ncbi:MAG: hypothetical protein ACK5HP_01295 [Bacilli bacterium]
MELVMPYFMTNKAWFYYTDSDGIKLKKGDTITVKLTTEGKKIPKVVMSYRQFIKDVEKDA